MSFVCGQHNSYKFKVLVNKPGFEHLVSSLNCVTVIKLLNLSVLHILHLKVG